MPARRQNGKLSPIFKRQVFMAFVAKRIHILGICGTFMGSLAQLAKALGHQVSGSDTGVYPPMSDQLIKAGIHLSEGFDPKNIPQDVDLVIIGNALSRGNPSVEYVLEQGLPYTSGPQWLGEEVLQKRWVLAVAGTHGKTTTSSMLAWILEYAGMQPGFLIGGVPENFEVSARLGGSPFFVIEADEYDTAFFDKRSKFVHYRPRTAILNNLEFDHADIFPDLAAIERQFNHLIRTIPSNGQIIFPNDEEAIERTLTQGCWSSVQRFGQDNADWTWRLENNDASSFSLHSEETGTATVNWQLSGLHNVKNAIAAMIAARHVGVTPEVAAEALGQFASVKRRMELVGETTNIQVYDDFAHHPTAIITTLEGAKAKFPNSRILAVVEPRSNTMKMGIHKDSLANSVAAADKAFWFQPDNLNWQLSDNIPADHCFNDHQQLIDAVVREAKPGDCIVVMSNGSFANMPRNLLAALQQAQQVTA